jgi:hypothetical protein
MPSENWPLPWSAARMSIFAHWEVFHEREKDDGKNSEKDHERKFRREDIAKTGQARRGG